MLREVVHTINIALRSEISWPFGEKLLQTESDFRVLCGLPGVVGAIDGTHVSIAKPRHGAADYFYYKPGGFTLNCQAVVDNRKRFLDLYLGMLGSSNDSRVLRRSSLFHLATHSRLWDLSLSFDGFSPFLLEDFGYSILPRHMVPHRGHGHLPLADSLFNVKLKRGRCVLENAFGLLKQSFCKLLVKSDLGVCFMPNVILACALLHSVIMGQSAEDIETLLHILQMEQEDGKVKEEEAPPIPKIEVVGTPLATPAVKPNNVISMFILLCSIVWECKELRAA